MLDRTPRSVRPVFREIGFPFRGSSAVTIEPSLLFRPTPFDLRRFRRGLSGLSRSVTASGFDAGGIPLCGLPFSSKLSPSRLHPHTHADAPLLGFSSPTALDNGGRPYSPMALQSHRHSPSSGFLDPLDGFLRPPPCRKPTIPSRVPLLPTALLGFPRILRLVPFLRTDRADRPRVSSPRLSPTLRRARFRALSSLALHRPSRTASFGGVTAGAAGATESMIAGLSAFSAVANCVCRPS